MANLRRSVAAGLMSAALFSPAAHADVIVDIRAFWSATLEPPRPGLPSTPAPVGLSITCLGTASSIPLGCSDRARISATLTAPSAVRVARLGGILVGNSGPETLNLTFRTEFSAFNPGGPDIGLTVTDPVVEFASFASSVTGPGVGDQHRCTTTAARPACGVPSPDFSGGFFFVNDLAPGQTQTFSFRTDIAVEAGRVSAPGSLALALLGMSSMFALARRQRALESRRVT